MHGVLQGVAGCCSIVQRVAGCCRVLQGVAGSCSIVQRVAVCCRVMHYVAECCSLLQCVAERENVRARERVGERVKERERQRERERETETEREREKEKERETKRIYTESARVYAKTQFCCFFPFFFLTRYTTSKTKKGRKCGSAREKGRRNRLKYRRPKRELRFWRENIGANERCVQGSTI